MALCPGLPRWAGTRRDIHPLTPEIINFSGRWSVIILDFKRHGKDNRGKCAVNPAGHYPINTPISIIPPVLCRMPFLPQPSQFILAWDRHQICWIAYSTLNYEAKMRNRCYVVHVQLHITT